MWSGLRKEMKEKREKSLIIYTKDCLPKSRDRQPLLFITVFRILRIL